MTRLRARGRTRRRSRRKSTRRREDLASSFSFGFRSLVKPSVDVDVDAGKSQRVSDQPRLARQLHSPVTNTVAALGDLAKGKPALSRKVDALGAVEAEVEARVIALGVGQDELARKLSDSIEGDARVGEHTRRSEESLVTKELRAL